MKLLRNAVEASSDDSGWAHLGFVGTTIANQLSDFDSRNYGFAKLSALVAATDLFDTEIREEGSTQYKTIFIRDKKQDR